MTKRTRALLLIVFTALAASHAQAHAHAAPSASQAESGRASGPPRARKVDEFGRLHGCDGGSRLDNFVVELQNEPGARGYVVARDSRNKLRGAAHAWGEYFLRYFVELRGMDAALFTLVDGAGVAGDELKMELWLVPAGAEPPRVKPPGEEDARPFGGQFVVMKIGRA